VLNETSVDVNIKVRGGFCFGEVKEHERGRRSIPFLVPLAID
jgi:hypothetical protein